MFYEVSRNRFTRDGIGGAPVKVSGLSGKCDHKFSLGRKVARLLHRPKLFPVNLQYECMKIVEKSNDEYRIFLSGFRSETVKDWLLNMEKLVNTQPFSTIFDYLYSILVNQPEMSSRQYFKLYMQFTNLMIRHELATKFDEMKAKKRPLIRLELDTHKYELEVKFTCIITMHQSNTIKRDARLEIDQGLRELKKWNSCKLKKDGKFNHFGKLPMELKRAIIMKTLEIEEKLSANTLMIMDPIFKSENLNSTYIPKTQSPSTVLLPLRTVNRTFMQHVNSLLKMFPIEKPVIAKSQLVKKNSLIQLAFQVPVYNSVYLPKLFCSQQMCLDLKPFLSKKCLNVELTNSGKFENPSEDGYVHISFTGLKFKNEKQVRFFQVVSWDNDV